MVRLVSLSSRFKSRLYCSWCAHCTVAFSLTDMHLDFLVRCGSSVNAKRSNRLMICAISNRVITYSMNAICERAQQIVREGGSCIELAGWQAGWCAVVGGPVCVFGRIETGGPSRDARRLRHRTKKPRPARVPARVPASLSASQARARASAAEALRLRVSGARASPLCFSLRSLEKIEKGRDTWNSPLLGSVSIHPFHPIPSHPLLHLVLVPIDSLCRFRLIWSAAINRHDIG